MGFSHHKSAGCEVLSYSVSSDEDESSSCYRGCHVFMFYLPSTIFVRYTLASLDLLEKMVVVGKE